MIAAHDDVPPPADKKVNNSTYPEQSFPNSEEDYTKDPKFHERFGPRDVISSTADGKIEDTGPLTKKRMETVDDETG